MIDIAKVSRRLRAVLFRSFNRLLSLVNNFRRNFLPITGRCQPVRDNSPRSTSRYSGAGKSGKMGDDAAPTKKKKGDRVAILDAGTPYAKRFDRACRELDIEAHIIPLETPAPTLKSRGYKGLLVAGGSGSVMHYDSPWFDPAMFTIGIPVLGVNYGMGMLVKTYGGTVKAKGGRQTGDVEIAIEDTSCPLFKGLKAKETFLMTHGESVEKLKGLAVIAKFHKEVIGVADVAKNLYGLRFHPEYGVGKSGMKVMENFLVSICKCKRTYTIAAREDVSREKILKQAAGRPVLMLCSGGLDSTVGAMLLKDVVGGQNLHCILVETGFEKKGMFEQARANLSAIGVSFEVVHAYTHFLEATTTVPNRERPQERRRVTRDMVDQTEPEDKRIICRDTLCHIAEQYMVKKWGSSQEACLGIGVLRPDIIDLGVHLANHVTRISKQHIMNVELLRRYRHEERLVEPVSEFHKREIVQVAKRLNAPEDCLKEHPFPSEVGMSMRIVSMHIVYVGRHFAETQVLCKNICEFHKMKPDHALMNIIESASDDEDRKDMKDASKRMALTATVMPLEVVGMHGSKKTYYYACALSDNKDFGVKWADAMYIAKMIIRIVHDVNRVAFAFGGKIGPIVRDVTPTYLDRHTFSVIQEADDIAHNILREKGIYGKIDQMPVVLLPMHFDRGLLSMEPSCRHSVVLRPIKSANLLSGYPAVPGKDIPNDALKQMVDTIKKLPGISRVLIDITTKPPAHVEWQ